jgi:hypothetical protein
VCFHGLQRLQQRHGPVQQLEPPKSKVALAQWALEQVDLAVAREEHRLRAGAPVEAPQTFEVPLPVAAHTSAVVDRRYSRLPRLQGRIPACREQTL